VDFGSGRLVLDQFNQRVAQDHFARRDRQIPANFVSGGGLRLVPDKHPARILQIALHATHQVLTVFGVGECQKLRVGAEEVGRRACVKKNPYCKFEHFLAVVGHSIHATDRFLH